MRHRSQLFAGVIGLALAVLTLAPSIAGARARIFEFVPGRAITYGFYNFPCTTPTLFPGTPTVLNAPPGTPSLYPSGLIASPAGCPGAFAYMIASVPAPGAAWAVGRVIGAGNAGLLAKLPSATAVTPDTLEDSVFVSVNRGTPGQVTISITGYAKHLNPVAAPNGALSKLKVAVYPDTTSAKNETGAIASGEMRFAGSSSRTFAGFFSAADFTTASTIGDGNDFIVSTSPGLQKVVVVPNAATAVVVAEVDPEGFTVPTGPVPQTIAIDGVNDFNGANLVDDDTGDTQALCDANTTRPVDLGKVYMTNDASYLYFGFEYARHCFPGINLGLAVDVNTPAGGTTDPFGRKIGWLNVANKPDYVVYDVIPNPANTFNYEVLYHDNGAGGWTVVHDGSNGLGLADVDGGNFVEGRILLSDLGVVTGSTIHTEYWVTQEGTTKGPLDAAFGDAVQMSRFSSTTFDTTAVVQMPGMFTYTILSSVDNISPTLSSAVAVNFPLLANKTFQPLTNKVDVTFSEPLDATTSQVAGNYTFGGPASRTITSAVLDGSSPNTVHLTLNAAIGANAAFYTITAAGVKDLANNTIVSNGTTNVGSFLVQTVTFNGDFRLPFCRGAFVASDTFSVEGSILPLTIATVGDNARMSDANADQIYNATVPFSFPKSNVTGKAEIDLLWKFSHTPSASPYEPGSDRFIRLSSDSGATVSLTKVWGEELATDFLDKPVDVVFKVKAVLPYLSGTHKLWLAGSELPLTFNKPGVAMKDDGVFPDDIAGDKTFAAKVRFPKCTPKNVRWKVVYDSTATDTVFECPDQGDRGVFVNSTVNDTVGGTLGPLVLAARGVNRCTVIDKAIAVRFRVAATTVTPLPTPSDTIAVMGSSGPLSFNTPPSPVQFAKDDGVAPDTYAHDRLYTLSVTFPDSTPMSIDYKYWFGAFPQPNHFECSASGNRNFRLDDLAYSVGTPQPRPVDIFDGCSVTAVEPPGGAGGGVEFATLSQNAPNPAGIDARIRFSLLRPGRVMLKVYDITGRQVATLIDAQLAAGPHESRWAGRDDAGHALGNGVYLYELSQGGQRLSRRMILIQR